ncbi:MAG: aromatic ring-hydroxylating dioxygenase subunit alpha [Planctomycetota bacterium]
MSPLPVPDADIRRATTPTGALYTDPKVHSHQREVTLPSSWQFLGDDSPVRVPQQFIPLTFLEGSVDEPLLLTRDEQDQIHCISNVCTHRGALVCEGAGNGRTLTCRYHGRRFNLDGTFKSMPEFDDACDFPRPEDDLAHVPLASWRQFLFASMRPSLAFEALTHDLDRLVGFLPIENATLDRSRSRDYLVRANWALYVENYLEGFHIPFVHPGLADAIDYGEYRTELFAFANLQLGIAATDEDAFTLPTDHPMAGERVAAFYFWLFPNTMFNVYPWGISVNVVQPLAVDRTRVSFLSYVWDASRLDQGAGADLDRVEREDEAIIESVQRGLRSRLYPGGRYSPGREQGVHHFHRLLTSAMLDPDGRPDA